MSKLKGVLLLFVAAIVMGCASQPKQPTEEPQEETPVVQEQQVAAEEKPAEAEQAPEARKDDGQNTNAETTVYFAPNAYIIDAFTARKLDGIAEQLKAKEVTKVTITGHSAKMDNARDEDRLSLQRAVAVARYFESIGAFDGSSMAIESAGATCPAGSHADIAERKHNRRVEIAY